MLARQAERAGRHSRGGAVAASQAATDPAARLVSMARIFMAETELTGADWQSYLLTSPRTVGGEPATRRRCHQSEAGHHRSHIHGNLEALHAVLDDIDRQQVDAIFCLGDVVGYGPNPCECLALVRDRCSLVLLGNHDQRPA